MTEHDLLDTSFWKILLDDLFVSIKTIGTPYSQMYNTARATSQGNQETYMVTKVPDEYNSQMNSFDLDDKELINHNLTVDLDDTVNLRRVSLMREVSI